MSNAKIVLRALPNVEFVHGFPGIPANPERPQATIRGAIEVRLGNQAVKAKWVQVELRKIETIPGGNRGEEFVDLVGQSPIIVWQAQDEHDTLTSKDFPFNIRVPETIPPSVALERGAGIKYEVVATLCTKGKKGLFRREASTPVSHSVPVVIDKHELHSTWPIYAQPESRHVISDGLTLAVDRGNTCFAPADRLSVIATLKSDNLSPVVFRGFEFSLRETIIYRAGPQSHGKKNSPLVQTTILGEQKVPILMTLYGGTQHKAELGCVVPGNHTTSSVNAGRHIDIGYSLNIKALIDMANPVTMDLPVTITNWPRHVSAEMTRRIGTATNLSLKSIPSPRPGAQVLPHALESRTGQTYGPPRPPPSGGLPSIPNGSSPHRTVPPGALVSGPPGSPHLSQVAGTMNPYSFQQSLYSTPVQASQQPPIAAAPEATSSDGQVIKMPGGADELGYNRQPGTQSATVPSRQSEKRDFGVTDASHRHATTNHRASNSQSDSNDFDIGSSSRISQYSQDADARASAVINPTTSTGRRARATSRNTTLKIMNADGDIPEEESPIKKNALTDTFDNKSRPGDMKTKSPPDSSASSVTPWPTADEEKQRLYEKAKAKAAKIQAQVKAGSEGASQADSPRPSNGHVSPPRQASPNIDQVGGSEGPRAISSSLPKSHWPTAEEEKQRLFERAQAQVRQAQGSVHTPSPSSSTQRPSHNRTVSTNSSQESHTNPALNTYATTSPPTLSAGAALYLHAMASIVRPASTITPYTPPLNPSIPHRNASHTGSGTSVSRNSAPIATRQPATADDDKSALRYLEANQAVERRHRVEGVIPESTPQEGPISYEELFGGHPGAVIASEQNGGTQITEKQLQARAYEARDTAAASEQIALATPLPQRSASTRSVETPSGLPTPQSEKEILRRAFEARDAAIMRSGQTPPLGASPLQSSSPVMPLAQASPPVRSSSWTGGSSSNVQPRPKAPLSEKERMKLAFEARDRALAAQQALPPEAPPPPDYEMPSPVPGPSPLLRSSSAHGPLTAAEEKAQLKARYAAEDAGIRMQPDKQPIVQQPQALERNPSSKSDSGETFLRRDPTISAGKKRASQMITPPPPSPPPPPPPLPPRPPAEYIEETKLEDRRNTLVASVTLPPSDFSSSFDLGFDSFAGGDETSSSL